jgi:hypothetical protein
VVQDNLQRHEKTCKHIHPDQDKSAWLTCSVCGKHKSRTKHKRAIHERSCLKKKNDSLVT